MSGAPSRRGVLARAARVTVAVTVGVRVGSTATRVAGLAGVTGLGLGLRPVHAAEPSLEDAIRAWAGGAQPGDGRITLEISPLVDNGNAVPVTVRVDSPMTAEDHVREIAIFNARNPQRDVARFHLGPASGRAVVSTRIRLATSQPIVALARMSDGSVWRQRAEVVVTLAACVEG